MSIEAMKQALEALQANNELINGTKTHGGLVFAMDGYYSVCFDIDGTNEQTEQAIAALRQAIEQAEKREWVGLAVNEAREFYESNLSRADLINKIDEFLEEKNRATAPVSE